jgi:hypothetical protein
MNIISQDQTKPQSALTGEVTEYRGRILHFPRTQMHVNISYLQNPSFKTAIAQEFTILNLRF